jgi:hypothetical protein
MTLRQWQRIKRIATDASELPPGQRQEFLTTACQGNDRLRAEVESLLRATEQAVGLFESVTIGLASPRVDPADTK